jgi:hypothetical protein
VDPRAGLDDVEERKFLILPGLELRPLGRPARSQSLYRLRYPGCHLIKYRDNFVLLVYITWMNSILKVLMFECVSCYSLLLSNVELT